MLSSWVWRHCERSADGSEATCKICDIVLRTKGSTSSINKHLRVVHGMNIEDSAENRKRRYGKHSTIEYYLQ